MEENELENEENQYVGWKKGRRSVIITPQP